MIIFKSLVDEDDFCGSRMKAVRCGNCNFKSTRDKRVNVLKRPINTLSRRPNRVNNKRTKSNSTTDGASLAAPLLDGTSATAS